MKTPPVEPGRTGIRDFPEPPPIPSAFSDVLEAYSNVPKASQRDHVITLRDRALATRPYPCLGYFLFLDLGISNHPLYISYILPTLTSTSTSDSTQKDPAFLDLGCCLGQDLRKLVHDGAAPSRLYGADLVPDFIELGYELFRDEHKFPRSHFLTPVDVLSSSASPLDQLNDKVDILHVSSVFHLFPLEPQGTVADRCLRLLRKALGSKVLICGHQTANVVAGQYRRRNGGWTYRHNEESWRELWDVVAAGDQWKGVVKSLNVKSELFERDFTSRFRGRESALRDRDDAEENEERRLPHRKTESGVADGGFRWMSWSVWVEFF